MITLAITQGDCLENGISRKGYLRMYWTVTLRIVNYGFDIIEAFKNSKSREEVLELLDRARLSEELPNVWEMEISLKEGEKWVSDLFQSYRNATFITSKSLLDFLNAVISDSRFNSLSKSTKDYYSTLLRNAELSLSELSISGINPNDFIELVFYD